ncbi:MAG: transposase zinc-binding domain-containing protein [Nannocystaceae bacterium]
MAGSQRGPPSGATGPSTGTTGSTYGTYGTYGTYAPEGPSTRTRKFNTAVRGPAFIAELAEAGIDLPACVQGDFDAFGRCGDLSHGFIHLACLRCGHKIFVPFSCKSRGFCPSCMRNAAAAIASVCDNPLSN